MVVEVRGILLEMLRSFSWSGQAVKTTVGRPCRVEKNLGIFDALLPLPEARDTGKNCSSKVKSVVRSSRVYYRLFYTIHKGWVSITLDKMVRGPHRVSYSGSLYKHFKVLWIGYRASKYWIVYYNVMDCSEYNTVTKILVIYFLRYWVNNQRILWTFPQRKLSLGRSLECK